MPCWGVWGSRSFSSKPFASKAFPSTKCCSHGGKCRWLAPAGSRLNTMDLPDYSSKDVLEEKLRTAVLRISK